MKDISVEKKPDAGRFSRQKLVKYKSILEIAEELEQSTDVIEQIIKEQIIKEQIIKEQIIKEHKLV